MSTIYRFQMTWNDFAFCQPMSQQTDNNTNNSNGIYRYKL